MSAPTSHDPLVVNTKDGACWTRRTVTEGGLALYALADVCKCPEFVMVTLAELAERGIVGSSDVLPVPVGPEPRSVEDELTGVRLSLYEEELENARLRLALASAQRGRRELRARVAELEGDVRRLNTQRGDVALLVERERGHGEECVDIDDLVPALCLGSDELPEAGEGS